MPRPPLPDLVNDIHPVPITISESILSKIALALGTNTVSENGITEIKHIIGVYLATEDGIKGCTKAKVLRLLRDINSTRKPIRQAALQHLMQNNAGVDSETHYLIAVPAFEAITGGGSELAKVQALAKQRYNNILSHPQTKVETESLRLFCGRAREVFNNFSIGESRGNLNQCRNFVYCLFEFLGKDYKTYLEHPDRLDDLILSEVR